MFGQGIWCLLMMVLTVECCRNENAPQPKRKSGSGTLRWGIHY